MIPLFPKATLFDDAGRLCDITTYRELLQDERRSDPAFADVSHRAGRALVATNRKLLFMLPAFLMQIGVMMTHTMLLPGWPLLMVVLLWLVPTMPCVWYIGRQNQQRSARRTADILLADGLCPGCVYNLAAQPEADGLVTCPECGAGWRAPRIARRHEFVASPETEAATVKRWWRQFGSVDSTGPTRISDDQGEERPIVHARLAQPIHAATGARHDRLRGARRAIRREARVGRGLIALFFLVAFGSSAVGIWQRGPGTGASIFLGVLWGVLATAFAIFLPTMLLLGCIGITTAHIRKVMLGHRLCPSCSADLGGQPEPAGDGLTKCHDCGAAWKLGPREPNNQELGNT